MNDELMNTLQMLNEWKRELDSAIPALVNVKKQIKESPEVQAILEIVFCHEEIQFSGK